MNSKKIIGWSLGLAVAVFSISLYLAIYYNPYHFDEPNLHRQLSNIEHFVEHQEETPFVRGIIDLRVNHNTKTLLVVVNTDIWEYTLEEDQLLQKNWEILTGNPYSVVYLDSKHLEEVH